MSNLRLVIVTFVAGICAAGLSVGAALAETTTPPPGKVTFAKDGKPVQAHECFLHSIF